MKFHINKQSEITAHEQLREQIIFLIGTGELAIGEEMLSVRAVARQLGISLNTVSKVYAELERAAWLVKRAGTHHMVVERKGSIKLSLPGSDLDDLSDYIISLAHARGYSLQQLATHLRRRLLEQPPDHLLIVEPDPGLGELMQEETRRKIGYAPPTCGLHYLQQNPAMGIGAILIAPAYIVDKLGQNVIDGRRILPVFYTPIDRLILAISSLSKPSMVGWVSVSAAGLKTISGMLAPAIGDRHSLHLFLTEQLNQAETDRFCLRRYRGEEYRPIDILQPRSTPDSASSPAESAITHDDDEILSLADLHCMDLIFTDSIAYRLIDHPHTVQHQLLSDDSLNRIKAAADALPQTAGIGGKSG